MAKLAEHIKVSRKQGTQAGFQYWYDRLVSVTNNGEGGLPAVRDLLAEVNAVGKMRTRGRNAGTFKNPEAALDFYCNKYEREIGKNVPKVKGQRQATSNTRTVAKPKGGESTQPDTGGTDLNSIIAAAVANAVAQVTGGGDLDETTDDEDDGTEQYDDADTHTGSRRVQRQSASTTQDDAPAFPPPRDPDAPATQGKLWKLNAEGPDNGIYLCVIDGDGNILAGGDEPITAGEAYDLIGEHIA